MLTSTAQYKLAIKRPHKVVADLDVFDTDGNVLVRDVPILGGACTAALTNRVSRTAQFVVAPQFFPTDLVNDPLSPIQAVCQIRAGIQYMDGTKELFPVITGRAYTVSQTADGDVEVQVDDRASDVVQNPFERPRNSNATTILTQINLLINDVIPVLAFGPNDVTDAPMPKLTWDEDRGQAIDDLAEALGGRWYTLGDGTFVVRRFPYDVGTPVQTISDAEEGDSLMRSATRTVTRDGTANSVTVVAERLDGSPPVRVTARDTSATSPTRWSGPYGRVTQVIKLQTPISAAEALTLARQQLNAATALLEQWTVACVPDMTLEPGDTVRLEYRGARSVQLIDSITYPLNELSEMTLQTRAFNRPPADVEEGA